MCQLCNESLNKCQCVLMFHIHVKSGILRSDPALNDVRLPLKSPRVPLIFLHLAFTHDPAKSILFRLKYKVALYSVYTCSKEINNLQAACKINMCLMLYFRSAEFVVVMAVVVYNCNGENGLDRSVPSRFVARASAGVFKSDVKRQNNLLQTGWNNS